MFRVKLTLFSAKFGNSAAIQIMRYCPQCETRFDEEVIKFCTKDGTPLIDDSPTFTEMPSESVVEEDDIGEITMIRRNDAPPPPPSLDEGLPPVAPVADRIRIPTSQPEMPQTVRPRTASVYYPPAPPPPNTAKTVVLTVLGTLLVLGAGAGLFWLLQSDKPANSNINTNVNGVNQNVNLNSNLGIDSNFNFNSAIPTSPLVSPSPFPSITPLPSLTPTPKPSPSVTPSPTASPTPVATPSRTPTGTPRPTPSGTPRMGPRPTPNPSP